MGQPACQNGRQATRRQGAHMRDDGLGALAGGLAVKLVARARQPHQQHWAARRIAALPAHLHLHAVLLQNL